MRIAVNRNLLKLHGRFYVVQFSDSLYLISQRFGVSVSDLLTYNDQLSGSSTIFPGEVLYIPEPMSKTLNQEADKQRSRQRSRRQRAQAGHLTSKHQSAKKRPPRS
ncbi:LysM peptidoglycan-binding domain-containing protein [Paenibacillus sp. TAB 01]|uniref:LysM peptidoglycan-binding domain-containing protein n=1 Tax=Paenibacillus sp. TAB 01 TaxID=3368988 RepID=UPI0037521ACB